MKKKARKSPAGSKRTRRVPPAVATHLAAMPTTNPGIDLLQVRELFWNNVIREMLTGLSAMTLAQVERGGVKADAPPASLGTKSEPAQPDESGGDDPFDGRFAVLTTAGARIPIAGVYPLFACGVPGTSGERALSMAVECTVFQLHTPSGEVFTLPLHEIRGFHALTDELMDDLAKAARASEGDATEEPFGFAAFTSLARGMPAAGHQARRVTPLSDEPAL